METPYVYFEKILSKLAESYPGNCTLEELAALVMPPYNIPKTFSENISAQRKNQAEILDVLILLEGLGYIVLDPASDKSCITAKGLVQINRRILSN